MDINYIIESNKLLHGFMKMNQGWCYHEAQLERYHYPHSVYDPCAYTKFHDDWNWLMGVVVKIESLGNYRVDVLGRNIVEVVANGEQSICLINKDKYSKIEAVYQAVVGFVKWYNEQK